MKTPTQAEVRDVLLKLQTDDRQAYFFEKLKSAAWLEPLLKEGVFAKAPEPIARGDRLYFPPWPAAKYLKNIAAESPDAVASVIAKLSTNNPAVQTDLVEIMLRLPPEHAAKLSGKTGPWIKQRLFSGLPMSLISLAEYLLHNGQIKAGLRLTRQLLSVEAREKEVKYPLWDRPDAVGIISDWYYGVAISQLCKAMLEVAPLQGFRMLVQILSDALKIESRSSEEAQPGLTSEAVIDDYSAIWMEDIDCDPKSNDVKEILAYNLLKMSNAIIANDPAVAAEVYAYLQRQQYALFLRIRLHAIASADDASTAAAELTSTGFWSLPGIDPERKLIANQFLPRLTDDQFALAMTRLHEAAPEKLFVDWATRMRGAEPRRSEVESYLQNWLLEQYDAIETTLRGDARTEYEALVAGLGSPERKDRERGVWVGPTSPLDTGQVAGMSAKEVVAFLAQWQPEKAWRAPTPEGVGRIIAPYVTRSPAEYLRLQNEILALHPVYQRHVIGAFDDAVKAKVIDDWTGLVDFMEQTLVRSESDFPNSFTDLDDFSADRNWNGLRHRLALLLYDLLRDESVPVGLTSRIWNMIEKLADDPDPTPEAEEKRGTIDPANAALNSVRGAAMLAVVRFALWTHQNVERGRTGGEPWAPALQKLTDHLDPMREPSVAVRSIYGEYLPWLQRVDDRWVRSNVTNIFPDAPEQAKLRRAAWSTYLVFCHVYRDTYDALRDVYAAEVKRMAGETTPDRYDVAARQHFAQHVWIIYGRGDSDLSDPNSLIRLFLTHASPELKAEVVESIGRSLQTDSTITTEILERLRELWRVIVQDTETSENADRVRILRPFGWWFPSKTLNENWAMEQLALVLSRTEGRVDPEFQVLPRLAELSERHPLETISLLKQMALAVEPFHLLNLKEHAGPVMKNAINAGGLAFDTAAEVHTLLSNQGVYDFRDLFEEKRR